jgi:hypothetical protein
MTQALNLILSLILGLFGAIMGAIAWTEDFLRGLMTRAGIPEEFQNPVLIIVAVLLILAAIRVLGRVFGVLIAIFLVLLLLHILFPEIQHLAVISAIRPPV